MFTKHFVPIFYDWPQGREGRVEEQEDKRKDEEGVRTTYEQLSICVAGAGPEQGRAGPLSG